MIGHEGRQTTHQGAEIDLILRRDDKLLGVECKRADSPRITPSMRIAMADLGLVSVAVICNSLAERVHAVPLASLANAARFFESVSE